MNTNQRYFGMTVMQIGILIGLGALAFLLFCITGWLVLARGFQSPPTLQALATATPALTATPTLTPTQTSTPGPTAVPYETLVPAGWTQYRTSLYEIWLPAGYKSGKVDPLISGLGDSPLVDLSLRGIYVAKSPNRIFVTVAYIPFTGDNFDTFLAQHISNFGPYLTINERSKVKINTVPATRLVFSGRKGSNDVNELTYIILDGTTIWYVQYTAVITEFFNLLPTFEKSANTFRVVK